MERIHQVIYNMFVTKDIDRKVYECIDSWGVTLASVAWVIGSSLDLLSSRNERTSLGKFV